MSPNLPNKAPKKEHIEPFQIKNIPHFYRGNYECDVPWSMLEGQLESWKEAFGMDTDPDFQRGHVWTMRQRSRFVEFVLRGGESAKVLLWNSPDWNGRLCDRTGKLPRGLVLVDGKQRLQSALMFLHNEVRVFPNEQNPKGYLLNEFDKPERAVGDHQCRFRFQVNCLETRTELLTWYLQLNDGGIAHTQAEIQKVKDMLDGEVKALVKIKEGSQ